VIEHEEGHLNPTFRLARRLAAHGHRVVYLGIPDGGDFVRAQGFEFVPILAQAFPRGTIRTLREKAKTEGAAAEAEIGAAARPGADSAYARSWRDLLDGGAELDGTVAALAPDLFVLTSFFLPHALVFEDRYRRPIVLLTTLLRTFPKSEYAVEVGRLLTFSAEAKARFLALLAGPGPAPLRTAGLAPRLLARVLRLRELILCPADLELPEQRRESEPEVHYVEPTVDLERRAEATFPWERLDPARRLVYVSLGSQSHRAGQERAAAFLRAAAEAFANRPAWQIVLSTGGLLEPAEIPAPPGAIVTPWAPQLDLLDRAALAVTHGGLGTVKECIVRGVPMVVFPIDHDQPDNARRVVYHGLGASGNLRSVSAAALAELVVQADRPVVRDNVQRMRRRFLDLEAQGNGVRLIEEKLGRPAGLTQGEGGP
jgi:zeaxanthin glucosyltransferase